MTDKGGCYRPAAFRKACARLGLRHLFARPYAAAAGSSAVIGSVGLIQSQQMPPRK